ncbi:MAG TPA: class I SAM-dependent methyltransferase [Euzebyales bacterium]
MTQPDETVDDDGHTGHEDRAEDMDVGPGTGHGAAWSAAADDYDRWWADLGAPVWDVLLDAAAVTRGTRLLDVACGPGWFLRMAADRGAVVAGIDAAERMVELARARVPEADVRLGGMERLPWAAASFDVVVAINAIQFADDPVDALAEIARVVEPGGSVGVCVWGPREDRHVLDIDHAVRALVPNDADAPDEPEDDHPSVPDWSGPGAVEGLMRDVELTPTDARLVDTPLLLHDRQMLIEAFLSDLQHSEAAHVAGLDAVRDAIGAAAAPYRRPDGSYLIPNTFRTVIATA